MPKEAKDSIEEQDEFLCAFCGHRVRGKRHKLLLDGERYDICSYCANLLREIVRDSLSGRWELEIVETLARELSEESS